MAVDTRNERAACLNLTLGFGRVFPNPDVGAEGQADRQQTALSYPGILATTAASIAAFLNDLTTIWCQDYQPALHAVNAGDDTTRVHVDIGHALGYDNENDLDTAYAKYINTEF